MSIFSKMTAIANKIRGLLGITEIMGLDNMATNLDTVQNNIEFAFTTIGNKGGTVPSFKVSGNLATAINSIPTGLNGISALSSGSFTLASDVSSSYSVNHGLDLTPNFFYVWVDGEINATDFQGYSTLIFCIHKDYITNGKSYVALQLSVYTVQGDSILTVAPATGKSERADSTVFNIHNTSARKLKAGVKYNWICGVIDNAV